MAGVAYHKIYYYRVLDKMDNSFDKGGDQSTLEERHVENKEEKFWVERENQRTLDEIFQGRIQGRYFLLIGEKGTGKTSAIVEAMKRVDGADCTIVDCSSDVELMRLRIGGALNFAFHEDYIGSLFSVRGPRETTALLDIERAFVKLEEVAKRKVKKTNKPLVMVFNNAHLIKNDADGAALVELLQQKAEMLSGAGLVTMIFNSDDYWLYERFKQMSTKLEILNFKDLTRREAISALRAARQRYFSEDLSEKSCEQVYELIGGRPQHINHVAAHKDMLKASNDLIDREKIWFLNQCGLLGEDMDDDVMESGKFSTSAMLLMRELVEMDRQRLKQLADEDKAGQGMTLKSKEHVLPELPLWRARQVMTRPDYIERYDHYNIFTIDSYSMVRADSVPMMRAFHEIASQPNFDQLLEETVDRVSAIESLGRTRELVWKDLALGGKFQISKHHKHGEGDPHEKYSMTLLGGTKEPEKGEEEEEDDPEAMKLDEIHEGARKKWWKKRMQGYGDSYVPEYVPAVAKEGDEKNDTPEIDVSRTDDGS
ncbi:unnamed protein product [Ambrosiozyma monospora]|uniref:Unnamed protein product n=1 Tax=Ambrosiozyma monospora TaxID=43982 RepID=A0ACB5T6Y8_AMBMO|nr:unnamed protein product [Ambrosiozyma monospora]